MTIIFGTAIIIAYMINSMLGMALMLVYAVHKLFFSRKGDFLYRVFELMIMSLPMSYIGIAGTSMHQLFSWYNLFLIVFVCILIRFYHGKIPMSRSAVFSLIIMLTCMLVNLLWTSNQFDALTEIAQILVMMIPLLITHAAREKFPISNEDAYKLVYEYVDICVATAIAMLIQYVTYYFVHRAIGIIHYTGGGRVAFYCLFRGASILPVYMGVGIVFLFIECFEKQISIEKLIKIGLIFFAVVLNTSRTALFMLMIVMAMVCIKYIARKPSFKGVFIALLGFVGAYYAIDYVTTLRSGLTGFLDANGRTTTWENGIHIWLVNIKNFLIGEGFSGGRWVGITKPHNMVIQTLAQCGVIIAFIVAVMLIRYIIHNRNNVYVFMPLFIILSGMLVTDFYANAFTTVIFVLVDLYYGTILVESDKDFLQEVQYAKG